jgi:NAD(P)H dehydrogenase (quinone)
MILLTGATGSAGSFVANEFVRQRVPVRILVRNRAKATELEKVPTVEVVESDMSSRSNLGSVLDGVDRVLMISLPRWTWWKRNAHLSMPASLREFAT